MSVNATVSTIPSSYILDMSVRGDRNRSISDSGRDWPVGAGNDGRPGQGERGQAAFSLLRIPTKPAGYPGVESASHSNLIAATVPSSSRPGGVVSSGRF